MAAKFVAEEGSLKGLILLLDDGDHWVIGRDPDSCQLLIEDPVASRRHLVCRATPEGTVIENLSTTNPVHVNGHELAEQQLLNDGDLVKIGSNTYRFYAESEVRLFSEEPDEGSVLPEQEESEDLQSIAPEEETIEDQIANEPEEEGTEDQREMREEEAPQEEQSFLDDEGEHEEIFSEEDLEEESDFNEAIQSRRDTIFDEEAAEEEALLADINFDMIETGRWLLKVIGGPNTGAEFTMRAGASYLLGTDPNSCDVIFNDTSVSRQQARIQVSSDDIITIEDQGSRNGTLVDGQRLEERHGLEPNIVVNIGTSAFVIFDREGEMHTIISPLLPSIVKVLQQEDNPLEEMDALDEEAAFEEQTAAAAAATAQAEEEATLRKKELKEKSSTTLTAFIMIAIITGTFVTLGIGMVTLFQSAPVELHNVEDSNLVLEEALARFPGVEYTFNKSTGNLMIVGHVLTDNALRQLRYNLEGLQFIKNADDSGVVIDEKVWQDLNPTLSRNPAWRGVTLQANAPGQFMLTGYLKNRDQMESLVEYMTANFLYLDHLQYRVIVEEDLIAKTRLDLSEAGFQNINVSVNNGDVILQGVIPNSLHDSFEKVLTEISKIPGVRNVQDYVTEIAQAKSTIDITDRYLVTGVSRTGGNVSVVIDGRIVSKGDILDGMTITEITTQAVFLERDNVNYRIDLRP
ncbi:MAG: type III secretion system inner membrane ring subunit SctD [Chlamydiota bacterium]